MSARPSKLWRMTGAANGRHPERYLHRDGYEETAEWIKRKLLNQRGPHLVEIRPDGGVRVKERNKISADEYEARVALPSYVGTYNRVALTEHIEDDLLDWLRSHP